MLNIAIPKTHYNKIDYPNLEDRGDGALVAIAIGDIHNIIPFCIDTVVGSTTAGVYQICGHPIHDVTEVGTPDGIILATPADYFLNVDKNEITLVTPHDPSGLVVDLEGAEKGGAPILDGADAIEYLVETVLGKDPLLLDPTYLADFKVDRMQEVKIWLDSETTFGAVVGKLESSLLFKLIPLLDGTHGTVVYEADPPGFPRPHFTDEDYLSFNIRHDWTAVKHKISIKYDEDVGGQFGFKVVEIPADYAHLFYETEETLAIETYLAGRTKDTAINRDGTPYSGTYCVRFDIDAMDYSALLLQEITLTPGAEYTVSLWYKTAAGKTMALRIRDGTLGAGGNVILQDDASWKTTGMIVLPSAIPWTNYTLVFNAHASYTAYVIEFGNAHGYSTEASSSFYVDDLSLLATIGAVEMLADGGLENWDDATHLTSWWEHIPNEAARILAIVYANMYLAPPIIAEFEVHGWGLDLIPGRDKVSLTKTRAWYWDKLTNATKPINDTLFRIIKLVKKPGTSTSTVVITAQLDTQTY
jgi:hypothetical protein